MRKFYRNHKFLCRIGIMFSFAVIAACASGPYEISAQYDPEPLPRYEEGTTIVYSSGDNEVVLSSRKDIIRWQDKDGNVSSGKPDFTYRRYTQDSPKIVRTFAPRQDILLRKPVSLWPLKAGNEAHFVETGIRILGDGTEKMYKAHWRCRVAGKEKISIKAGEFDTWKIIGKRYSQKRRRASFRLRETKTWYYAPSIGHYVLTTSEYTQKNKAAKRVEVIAVIPPYRTLSNEATEKLETTFQSTMNANRSGQLAYWSVPGENVSGTITPAGTFRNKEGTYFRRYVMSLNRPQSQKTYFGLVYRDKDGTWRFPASPDGPPMSTALGIGG